MWVLIIFMCSKKFLFFFLIPHAYETIKTLDGDICEKFKIQRMCCLAVEWGGGEYLRETFDPKYESDTPSKEGVWRLWDMRFALKSLKHVHLGLTASV